MDEKDLEKLGLNKNEAKVYLALIYKGQATASELVKSIGVHRNIIYDNLEKLIDKGLVAVITDTKKIFIAQKPTAILEFLESKKILVDTEITLAKNIIPDINKVLTSQKTQQEAYIFRGVGGLKRILSEIVQAKKSWCLGMTNESIKILGDTYWKNYNLKKRESKTEEWLLWNHNYDQQITIKNPLSHHKILPKDLNQVTETIIWDNKVAIFAYSSPPIAIVIDNKEIFNMHRAQFEFLWKISKSKN